MAARSGSGNHWLRAWYGNGRWVYLLLPLTGLFRLVSALRRVVLIRFRQIRVPVPVIVVGNINLGGTGKTPLIIALAAHLQQRGYVPGVIGRGYGGRAPAYPLLVNAQTPPEHSGDEALAIAQRTGCAVCVDPDRVAAARRLSNLGCNILLSDDGLQHYRLARDLEIAVVDGQRGFGNGFCIPTGPLREPITRLRSVDWTIVNSPSSEMDIPTFSPCFNMNLEPVHWQRLEDGQIFGLDHFSPGAIVQAIAGIGNPRRFYTTLRELGLEVREGDFPDHYQYGPEDFTFDPSVPLVMTAKDAVKCTDFAGPDWYCLVIRAQLPDEFWSALDARLTWLHEERQ